jgi:hypothetical protein
MKAKACTSNLATFVIMVAWLCGLLLTACATTTSDASICRRAIGVWSSDSQPGKSIENRSDGIIVVKVNGLETARGKWQVKNGYVIEGIGNSIVESNKVLKVSRDEMVILSIDGHTQLTWRRQ